MILDWTYPAPAPKCPRGWRDPAGHCRDDPTTALAKLSTRKKQKSVMWQLRFNVREGSQLMCPIHVSTTGAFGAYGMVKRGLTRRDQAGLPQPDRASLLASAGGFRETHTARETTVAGASFFTFLSHITRSQHKRRISHQTSDRSRSMMAGDWRWRVYTNNVAATTTNGADPSDTRPWGHFLVWTPCSEPQHK